jgi:hypothetical protein
MRNLVHIARALRMLDPLWHSGIVSQRQKPVNFKVAHYPKAQGIASELLRRSALGLENGVSSGSRIGAAWHYEDEKGFSLQRDLLPATTGKVGLRNFDRPKNIVFPPLKRRAPSLAMTRRHGSSDS